MKYPNLVRIYGERWRTQNNFSNIDNMSTFAARHYPAQQAYDGWAMPVFADTSKYVVL